MTIPKNVTVCFDDFCEDCSSCDVDYRKMINTDGMFRSLEWFQVECKNRYICRKWNERLRGEQNESDSV